MNMKQLRNLRFEGTTMLVRFVHCTNCGMRKAIVPDENYNAYDLDLTSRCCKHPDFRL